VGAVSEDRRRNFAELFNRPNPTLEADMRTFAAALQAEQGGDTIDIGADGRAALTRIRRYYAKLRTRLGATPGSDAVVAALTRLDQAFAQAALVLDANATFPEALAQRSVRNASRAMAELARAVR
jgi:hypothetical protein